MCFVNKRLKKKRKKGEPHQIFTIIWPNLQYSSQIVETGAISLEFSPKFLHSLLTPSFSLTFAPLLPQCWARRILKQWDDCNTQINIGEGENHTSVSRFVTSIVDNKQFLFFPLPSSVTPKWPRTWRTLVCCVRFRRSHVRALPSPCQTYRVSSPVPSLQKRPHRGRKALNVRARGRGATPDFKWRGWSKEFFFFWGGGGGDFWFWDFLRETIWHGLLKLASSFLGGLI